MKVRSHKDLHVWEKAMTLAERIYLVTERFPKAELYGLTAQLRRAAASVPANIAEGSGRNSPKEFAYFSGIAAGSASEVETLLLLSIRVGLAPYAQCEEILELANDIGRMLTGLRKNLEGKATKPLQAQTLAQAHS